MSDDNPPQRFLDPGCKLDEEFSPISKKVLDHAPINEEHVSQKPQRRQSIVFDTDIALSPLSKQKLRKALAVENAWPNADDSIAKEVWVEDRANELHQAFAKGRKAESSTSGFSESADRWSAREGTAQDLRNTLTAIFEKYGPIVLMYKGHDALGRNWVSGWKAATGQMAVVICIEKEEAKNKLQVSVASVPADTKQAEIDDDGGLMERGKEK